MIDLASKFMRPEVQIPRLISLQLPVIPVELQDKYYFVVTEE